MKLTHYIWIVELRDLNLLKSSRTIIYTFDGSQPFLHQQQRQPFLQNSIIQINDSELYYKKSLLRYLTPKY